MPKARRGRVLLCNSPSPFAKSPLSRPPIHDPNHGGGGQCSRAPRSCNAQRRSSSSIGTVSLVSGQSPSAKPVNYTTAQSPGRGRRARKTPIPATRRSPAPAARPRMCRGGGPRERTVVTAKCKETPVFGALMLLFLCHRQLARRCLRRRSQHDVHVHFCLPRTFLGRLLYNSPS